MNILSYSRDTLEKFSKQELITLLLAEQPDANSSPKTSRQKSAPPESEQRQTPSAADQTKLYQQVAENFPNGAVAVLDRYARYQFIAGKEIEKLGKSSQDFIGRPIGVLPVDRATKEKLYRAFQKGLRGKNCEIEVTFQSHTYLIHVIPLTADQGTVTQVLALLQNITAQKKTLVETQYQKAQLESLIENVDDAIWSVDRENRLMLGNSAFYQAMQRLYKADIQPGQKIHEQVTYEKFIRVFRSDAQPELFLNEWNHYQERALQGEKLTAEIQYPFRFGNISIRISFNPVFDALQQVIGITFYVHNVTDLRHALRQAQEQEQQFKALAENIPGVVYIAAKHPACQCIYISDEVTQLTGYAAQDFRDEKIGIQDLLHPADRASVRQAYIQARHQKRPYYFVYRLRHRQGHYRWVEEHGTSLDRGDTLIFQGVILDVSEKRRYEEQLELQNQDLRKINAELDHFAYSVSHDLRSPLTSAMGLLMLLQQEEIPAQQHEYIDIINRNLQKLDAYIQDIILLSKNARTETVVNEIHFEKLLADVLESQKYGVEFDQVRLYTQVNQSKPFHSDRRRLKIILNNLISNALKYSFARRDQPFAQITIDATDDQVRMQVRDNGIGIQDEHLPHIFDMFYRGTDRKSGSGLGLYLVKETLEKLGGSIEVTSVYGEGTTFTVEVPVLVSEH
ncbi:MAG: PAS domain-containing sensor histidine kinase [Cyclobacteriaceae bacterium]